MRTDLTLSAPVRLRTADVARWSHGLRGTARELVPPGYERATHPSGRVCSHPGCDTQLSMYNPESTCDLHRPEPDMTYYGRTFRLCQCGVVITDKSKSGLCPSCSRKKRRRASLRKDGRPDAVQRAQRALAS